jgi:hypothetical protein
MGNQSPPSSPHADHGTVLKPSEAALVVSEDGALRLLMPRYSDDQDVPEMVLLLGAVLVRSQDREWVEDMLVQLEDVD